MEPPELMETQAGSIAQTSAAAVKPSERVAMFRSYREFCKEYGLDADCYPINPHAFKTFASAVGIGRKSRKARKLRRILKDNLSRPARRHAAVRPKAGPPKGPPDQWGRREYYSLDACRRGGIKSGAVRRQNVRHRNRSIRETVRKHGLTRQEAANRHGVSLRTVYYRPQTNSLLQGPQTRAGPWISRTCNEHFTGRQRSVLPVTLPPPSHACRCTRGRRWRSSCSGCA